MNRWLDKILKRRRSMEPVRPTVKPDRSWMDELERRRAALDYEPEIGFHRDRRQERAT